MSRLHNLFTKLAEWKLIDLYAKLHLLDTLNMYKFNIEYV